MAKDGRVIVEVISLPENISAIAFDLDQTLYDNKAYISSHKTVLLRQLAERLKRSFDLVEADVDKVKEQYSLANEGKTLSLTDTLSRFGISIKEVSSWKELFSPESFLGPDPKLAETLEILSKRYKIAAVTNSPTNVGLRTLGVLGVEKYFSEVIGLDIAGESKPSMKFYRILSERMSIPIPQMVSVGDRKDIDIEVPVKNGMGGIWVKSVEGVYRLPEILR